MKTIMQTFCGDCLYAPMCKKSTVHTHNSDYGEIISQLENPEGYYMSICSEFEDKSQYIKLPCKVGDTVYVDTRTLLTYSRGIKEENLPAYFVGKVVSFRITEKKKLVKIRIQEKWLDNYYFVSFGKTVFLTREEAEKALREVKEND